MSNHNFSATFHTIRDTALGTRLCGIVQEQYHLVDDEQRRQIELEPTQSININEHGHVPMFTL